MSTDIKDVGRLAAQLNSGKLSERQEKLLEFLNSLDADYRHSFTLICQGSEPSRIEDVVEHRDIDLQRSERLQLDR